MTATTVAAEVIAAIDQALADGDPISAIRLYREATGSALHPARQYIDARRAALASASLPEPVRAYLASGYARQGALLAHWRNPLGDWCVLVDTAAADATPLELGVFPDAVGSWGHALSGYRLGWDRLRAALDGAGLDGAGWGDDDAVRNALRARLPVAQRAAATASGYCLPPPFPNRSAMMVIEGARFVQDWWLLPWRPEPSLWQARLAALDTDPGLRGALEAEQRPGTDPVDAASAWVLCHHHCVRSGWMTANGERVFADLEAQPPDWQRLSPDARAGFALLRGLVDCAGQQYERLPWWLAAAARRRGARIGLTDPFQLALLAGQADALLAAFQGHAVAGDIGAVLTCVRDAAASGAWLLGWEPES